MEQQQDICPFLYWLCPSKYCYGEKYQTCEKAKERFAAIETEHNLVCWLRHIMNMAPFTQEEANIIIQTIYNYLKGK